MLIRAVAGLTLFEKADNYEAFERVLGEAIAREHLPIFAYTVMPHHWHFVVRPQTDSQLSDFFRWLTDTHTTSGAAKLLNCKPSRSGCQTVRLR